MAENLGSMYFDIDANTQKFDAKLASVSSSAKAVASSVNNSMSGMGRNVGSGLGSALGEVRNFASGITTHLGNIGSAFTGVSNQLRPIGLLAGVAFGLMGKFSLDMVRSVQKSTVAMTAYTGSAKVASAITKDLIDFAKSDRGVLFNRDELLNITTRLAGLRKEGLETKNELVGFIKAVAPAAAVFKSNTGSATYFGEILGQILGTGKLLTQDYRQLANAGIILDRSLIGQTMTAKTLRAALEKAVPASLLDAQAKTIDGRLIRLKTSFRELGNQILGVDYGGALGASFKKGSLGDQGMKAIEEFTRLMKRDEIKDAFERMGQSLGRFVNDAVPKLVDGFKFMAENIDTIISAVKLFAKAWIAVKLGGFIASVGKLGLGILQLAGFLLGSILRLGAYTASTISATAANNAFTVSAGRAGLAMQGFGLAGTRVGTATKAASTGTKGLASGAGAIGTASIGARGGLIGLAAAAAVVVGAFGLKLWTDYKAKQKAVQDQAAATSQSIADLTKKMAGAPPDRRAQYQAQIDQLRKFGRTYGDSFGRVPVQVKSGLNRAQIEALNGTKGIVQTSLGALEVLPDGAGVVFYRMPGAARPGMTNAQVASKAIAEATKRDVLGSLGGIPAGVPLALAGTDGKVRASLGKVPTTARNAVSPTSDWVSAALGLTPQKAGRATSGTPGAVAKSVSPTKKKAQSEGQQASNLLGSALGTAPGKAGKAVRPVPGKVSGELKGMKKTGSSRGGDLVSGLAGALSAATNPGSLLMRAAAKIISVLDKIIRKKSESKSPSQMTARIGEDLTAGLAVGMLAATNVATKAAEKLVGAVDRKIRRLNKKSKQRKILIGLQEDRKTRAKEISESLNQAANIVQGGGQGPQGVFDVLQQQLTAVKDFRGSIATLVSKGLDKGMLKELVDAGVDVGGALAAELAGATTEQIRQINAARAEIAKTASGIASTISNVFFASSVKAAKGVSGTLKRQASNALKVVPTGEGFDTTSDSGVNLNIYPRQLTDADLDMIRNRAAFKSGLALGAI